VMTTPSAHGFAAEYEGEKPVYGGFEQIPAN
jgi:hypothetical protein